MKTNLKILLLSTLTVLSFSACTSTKSQLVSVSDAHLYNTNYGVVPSHLADQQLQQELVAMNMSTQVEAPTSLPLGWTTNLTKDADAFYAHEYVERPEVITYKYKFDKNFYDKPEWRSANN